MIKPLNMEIRIRSYVCMYLICVSFIYKHAIAKLANAMDCYGSSNDFMYVCLPGTNECSACKNTNQPFSNKKPSASTSHQSKYKTFKDPWNELQERVIFVEIQHGVKFCIIFVVFTVLYITLLATVL